MLPASLSSRALAALLALSLFQTAEAQSPHDFTLDASRSQLQWSVTSSAGPLPARSPVALAPSGTAELGLFATTPVQALELRSESELLLPTLRAWIPSPNPFAPTPFDLRLAGLAFGLESLELPVDSSGLFAPTASLQITAGTANFAFFGAPRPAVSLTSLPPVSSTAQAGGQLTRQGSLFELQLPIDVQFVIVEATTLASAQLHLSGTLVATAFALDEIANRYCTPEGQASGVCTPCPCGNDAPGLIGGCVNEFGTRASLTAQGSNSVSAANLTLELHGASPGSFALLLSGSARGPSNPSSPCYGTDTGFVTSFSDGLRCLTTSLQRHGFRSTDLRGSTSAAPWSGTSLFGPSGQAPGQTRHYQALYRTDAALGCGTGQNSSDALSITAVP